MSVSNNFLDLNTRIQNLERQLCDDLQNPNSGESTWDERLRQVADLANSLGSLQESFSDQTTRFLCFRDPLIQEEISEEKGSQVVFFKDPQSEPALVDFDLGFSNRIKDITSIINYALDSCNNWKHTGLYKKLYPLDPELQYDQELTKSLTKQVLLLEADRITHYFRGPKVGVDRLVAMLFQVNGFLRLSDEVITRHQTPLRQRLTQISSTISEELAKRPCTIDVSILEQKINLIKTSAKHTYWALNSCDAEELAVAKINIQIGLSTLEAFRDLLKNESVDPERRDELNKEMDKIENKLNSANNYLLPFLIQKSAWLKLQSIRAQPELEKVKNLRIAIEENECKTLEEFKRRLLEEISNQGGCGKLGREYLSSPSSPQLSWGKKSDPRIIKVSKKFKEKVANNQPISLKEIEKIQSRLATFKGQNLGTMTKGTEEKIEELSRSLDSYASKFFASKSPAASKSEDSAPQAPVETGKKSIPQPRIELMSFPCSKYPADCKIAVRGDIGGLNWNQNTPLSIRDGKYIFEPFPEDFSKGGKEYKFVMLTPGGRELWENFVGNRNSSKQNSTPPTFSR